jgi:excinuclease ABC subunit C
MPEYESDRPHLDKGVAVIKRQVELLPDSPGVYRMINEKADILYIGKAKSLKRRVANYTSPARLPMRLQRMIAETTSMEFIHTHTEVEALLLESNLIKKHRPRYNILLKDDKSLPYIFISADHDFPQMFKQRGSRTRKGYYYGPFAGGYAVTDTVETLQKAFQIRNCTDAYFAARTRPCLQYHIKRCTAPCVGLVSKEDYAAQVKDARDYLDGKSRAIQERLVHDMEQASAAQAYEKAAALRDRIKLLTSLQTTQNINIPLADDMDVIALARKENKSCIQIFFFRKGQNFGNRPFFPSHSQDDSDGDILAAFIMQFYASRPAPPLLVTSHEVTQSALLSEALSTRSFQDYKVNLASPVRGQKRELVDFALRNADDALERYLIARKSDEVLLQELTKLFELKDIPRRIEVYDNSHISGTNMIGAMIVASGEGFQKSSYRKFNIRQSGKADDYAMMREVLTRRFARALEEGDAATWPDLVLIDGGLGQLNAAIDVCAELNVLDKLTLVAIAKGEDRNAGRETFFMQDKAPFKLDETSPVLHYLQRLRDEAHRFAIGTHRAKRVGQLGVSVLDQIPGVGAKRKKALLHHFGSAKAVEGAALADLEKVGGVSKETARQIYSFFHEDKA